MTGRKITLLLAAAGSFTFFLSGCGSEELQQAGFLSDYSRLRPKNDYSMVYINETLLKKYSAFIVDPVQMHLMHEAESTKKLTAAQKVELRNYMQKKLAAAVRKTGKDVVYSRAKNVAVIRTALTDIQKTDLVNVVPIGSVAGIGVGGASVEFEIVDSMTGQQIAAAIESKKGSRIPFTNMGNWATAKSIMDDWAKRLQARLE